MKLSEMEAELSRMVRDDGLRALLVAWINNAILEVATDFELASLRLIDPEAVTVDTSKWLWPMPADFHKRLLRAQWVGDDGTQHHIKVHDHISSLEYRDHTQTGDWVTEVAAGVQGGTGGVQTYLGIYPSGRPGHQPLVLPQTRGPVQSQRCLRLHPGDLRAAGDLSSCHYPELQDHRGSGGGLCYELRFFAILEGRTDAGRPGPQELLCQELQQTPAHRGQRPHRTEPEILPWLQVRASSPPPSTASRA